MSGAVSRALGRLSVGSTALFVCDMQEAFRKTIQYYPEIIKNTCRLIEAAKLLDIPIIMTEQYPKGLGHTVHEIKSVAPEDVKIFDKTLFSMCLPGIEEDLSSGRESKEPVTDIILTGIECHVCVLQTTLDLLSKNYYVHIAADCVSSRSLIDRTFALKRFAQIGAFVSTSESLMLQLCKDSKHPAFKAMQKLIMEPCADTGLLSKKQDGRLS